MNPLFSSIPGLNPSDARGTPTQTAKICLQKEERCLPRERISLLESLWPNTPWSRIQRGQAAWSHFGALESSFHPSASETAGRSYIIHVRWISVNSSDNEEKYFWDLET